MAKSIAEQIKELKIEIEKSEKTLSQLQHQKDKIIKNNNNAKRNKRTRNLIERGAILESMNPNFNLISNNQSQEYLQKIFHTYDARKLLEDIIQTNAKT